MDFDLAEVLADTAAGRLDPAKLRWKPGASVCLVLASGGYPGKFATGKLIDGLTDLATDTGVKVLHAGTRLIGDSIVTSGGRVLGVTAARPTLAEAVATVYLTAERIEFEGMHYRRDIAGHASQVGAASD
jgi:phosphoribosylamine--glycine ligase